MPTEVVEQQHRDLAHGNPEDEEPADGRDDKERWHEQKVEEEEEDDAADIPLATTKQPSLHLRQIWIRASPAAAPKEALGLIRLRVDAPSGTTNDGPVPV